MTIRTRKLRPTPISRVVTIAVLAAAVTCSIGGRAGASPHTVACATSDLVAWLNTNGNAGAGSAYYSLEFTNLSGRRCAIRGYPGLSAVDVSGHVLGSAASRNPQLSVRTVVLDPGATAHSVLRLADPSDYPSGICAPTTAAGFRVHPPNTTTSRHIPFPAHACSKRGPAYLYVQAVTP